MFNFNGETWHIILVSPEHPMLLKSDGQYTIGVCDDNLKSIYINDMLNPQKFKKVLCHEITHAAMFSYNIDLTIEQEELLADLLATFGQEIVFETNRVFNRIKRERLV